MNEGVESERTHAEGCGRVCPRNPYGGKHYRQINSSPDVYLVRVPF